MKTEVSVSILSADFCKLAEAIAMAEKAGVDRLHIDVMDGHFVPNISIGPVVLAAVRKYTRLPIAAHLMIEHPWDYLDDFIQAGADAIAIHAECYGERRSSCRAYGQYPKEIDAFDAQMLRRDLRRIQDQGRRAFVVVNPGTPVDCLERVLGEIDGVLMMSVNPGFAGQKFIPEAVDRVRTLRGMFEKDIVVDGGINAESAPKVVEAGANVLVTASYFFNNPDPAGVVRSFHGLGRS